MRHLDYPETLDWLSRRAGRVVSVGVFLDGDRPGRPVLVAKGTLGPIEAVSERAREEEHGLAFFPVAGDSDWSEVGLVGLYLSAERFSHSSIVDGELMVWLEQTHLRVSVEPAPGPA